MKATLVIFKESGKWSHNIDFEVPKEYENDLYNFVTKSFSDMKNDVALFVEDGRPVRLIKKEEF